MTERVSIVSLVQQLQRQISELLASIRILTKKLNDATKAVQRLEADNEALRLRCEDIERAISH